MSKGKEKEKAKKGGILGFFGFGNGNKGGSSDNSGSSSRESSLNDDKLLYENGDFNPSNIFQEETIKVGSNSPSSGSSTPISTPNVQSNNLTQFKAGHSVPVIFIPVPLQTAARTNQQDSFNVSSEDFSINDDDDEFCIGSTLQEALGNTKEALKVAGNAVAPFSSQISPKGPSSNKGDSSNEGHSSSLDAANTTSPREDGTQLLVLGCQSPPEQNTGD